MSSPPAGRSLLVTAPGAAERTAPDAVLLPTPSRSRRRPAPDVAPRFSWARDSPGRPPSGPTGAVIAETRVVTGHSRKVYKVLIGKKRHAWRCGVGPVCVAHSFD